MKLKDVIKGIDCCSEFLCGECPYKMYESKDYPLQCIHKLMVDIKEQKDNAITITDMMSDDKTRLALLMLVKAVLKLTINTCAEQGIDGVNEVVDILSQVETLVE